MFCSGIDELTFRVHTHVDGNLHAKINDNNIAVRCVGPIQDVLRPLLSAAGHAIEK